MVVDAAPATQRAFDRHASDYDGTFGDDPLAQRLRHRVWERIARHLTGPSLLLDLGCGTGIDAVHHARAGHRVVAADASPGMLEELRRKIEPEAELRERVRTCLLDAADGESWRSMVASTLPEERVDLVYSDFGAVNCLSDLTVIADWAHRLLVPGGILLLVVMPPVAPCELASTVWRGRAGLRRLASEPTAEVEGVRIPITYHSVASLRRQLAPGFQLHHVASLGLVLPAPPFGAGLPAPLLQGLDTLDRTLGRIPLLRRFGDHVIVELKRSAT